MSTNAQYEAMRLDIACLKRENYELKAKLAAAEARCDYLLSENRRLVGSDVWEADMQSKLAAAETENARLRRLCEPVAMTDEEEKFYRDSGLEGK